MLSESRSALRKDLAQGLSVPILTPNNFPQKQMRKEKKSRVPMNGHCVS